MSGAAGSSYGPKDGGLLTNPIVLLGKDDGHTDSFRTGTDQYGMEPVSK